MTLRPFVRKVKPGKGLSSGLWCVVRPSARAFHVNVSYWLRWSDAVRHAITGKWAE